MLKILFGRYSRLVRIVELAAVLQVAFILYRFFRAGLDSIPDVLFCLLIAHYLFIRFCHHYKWYPGVKSRDPSQPELGIALHFLKALVPTSYILLGTSTLFLLGLAWPATVLANLMMIVVSGVNVILISFHLKDRDLLPVNYFTRELILSDASAVAKHQCHKQHLVRLKRQEDRRERSAA